jgi:hypothetical protein
MEKLSKSKVVFKFKNRLEKKDKLSKGQETLKMMVQKREKMKLRKEKRKKHLFPLQTK